MTDDLRRLAEAAQNDVAVLYSQGDARITVSTFTTFAQKAEYHAACSPDRILALLAERDALLATLRTYPPDLMAERDALLAVAEAAQGLLQAGCWGHVDHSAERCAAGALRESVVRLDALRGERDA
jgi:hypothetical protein